MKLAIPHYQYTVKSLDRMNPEYRYSSGSLHDVILARGRSLAEALKNDPDGPEGVTYSRVKYYSVAEIREYADSVNKGAGVVVKDHPNAFPEAQDPSGCAGIYFLKCDGEITYVGQALNVLSRVQAHVNEKVFDSVDFMPCLEKDLNDLEGLFIRLIAPNGNARPYTYSHKGLSAPKSNLWDRIVPIHGVRSKSKG